MVTHCSYGAQNKTILTLRGHIWTAKSVGSDKVRAVAHSQRKLFSGFSSIDLQIDEVENNDRKESSPQLYLLSESNLKVRLCGHNVGLAVVTKLSKALHQVQLKMGHLQVDITRCPLC
jgi:hypothetical protein